MRNVINNIKRAIKQLNESNKTPCRIDEIDVTENRVIIYCHGSRNIIKTTIAEAMSDPLLLNQIPPLQAYCLGYYYGKISTEMRLLKSNLSKEFEPREWNFSLFSDNGKYRVFSYDRLHDLTYENITTSEKHKANIIRVAQNEALLSEFDPSQACYIGLLAGIFIA